MTAADIDRGTWRQISQFAPADLTNEGTGYDLAFEDRPSIDSPHDCVAVDELTVCWFCRQPSSDVKRHPPLAATVADVPGVEPVR